MSDQTADPRQPITDQERADDARRARQQLSDALDAAQGIAQAQQASHLEQARPRTAGVDESNAQATADAIAVLVRARVQAAEVEVAWGILNRAQARLSRQLRTYLTGGVQ